MTGERKGRQFVFVVHRPLGHEQIYSGNEKNCTLSSDLGHFQCYMSWRVVIALYLKGRVKIMV